MYVWSCDGVCVGEDKHKNAVTVVIYMYERYFMSCDGHVITHNGWTWVSGDVSEDDDLHTTVGKIQVTHL